MAKAFEKGKTFGGSHNTAVFKGQSAHDDGIDYDKYSRDEGGCTTSKSCQHRTKQYNENES